MQSLLRRSDFTGRIAKWGTRLGMFNLCYKSRNSIKGQVLANFVAEFTPSSGLDGNMSGQSGSMEGIHGWSF